MAAFTYTNSEGQSFDSDEIRLELEGQARWVRTDNASGETVAGVPAGPVPTLFAGSVAPDVGGEGGFEVSGGPFHLTSVTAGGFPPHEVLTTEQAIERAEAQLDVLKEQQRIERAAQDKAEATAVAAAELEREREAEAALEESRKLGETAKVARSVGKVVGTNGEVTDPELADDTADVFPEKFALPTEPKGNASGPDWANYALALGVAFDPDEDGRDAIREKVAEHKEANPEWADAFDDGTTEPFTETPDQSDATTPAQGDGEPNQAPARP
jgi:hypothetical protein